MATGKDKYVCFDPMNSAAKIYGLTPGEYNRAPEHLREKMNGNLRALSVNTSGGRIRFNTDSEKLSLHMDLTDLPGFSHMPASGSSGLDIFVGSGKNMTYAATRQPQCNRKRLKEEVTLSKGEKTVTIYLPLYNGVKALKIGIENGTRLNAPTPYTFEKPVVFYGSSITQGGCACRTSNSYCALAARYFDSDFTNLGFSGNAKGEPYMAEYIAGLEMSCFVLDYDHNAPDAENLRKTHLPFLQTILKAQPELPVIIMSKPDTNFSSTDNERRDIVKASYLAVKDKHPKVQFIDGGTLFGSDFRESCTVDGCHPNDLGFYRMAKAVIPALEKALGL